MTLPWLDPQIIAFPDTTDALEVPNGLLAAGGALTSEWLLHAYTKGIFPWFSDGDPILWWSPSPRSIIYIDQLHISKSLSKTLRKTTFTVTFDKAFESVVEACSQPRKSDTEGDPGTWITTEIQAAYSQLHQLGYAHSVEVWDEERLIGGLYGIALGRVFFGESMFSRQSNGSKIALAHLAKTLKKWHYKAIDCQVHSQHLTTLGAIQVPRAEFEALLKQYVHGIPCHWNLA